ncbi:hypothetical protein Hanom_Chr02g00165181 [Helianthus anomalus]
MNLPLKQGDMIRQVNKHRTSSPVPSPSSITCQVSFIISILHMVFGNRASRPWTIKQSNVMRF